MLGQNFSFDERDADLEEWLEKFLGTEVFSPEENRLPKYFQKFKDLYLEKDVPIVTIAGTNGKGEVALLLESLFLNNGFTPMLWTSPHTLSVRERFSCGGFPIEASRLFEIFKENESLSKSLSFYEFLFYCFCQWCSHLLDSVEKPVIIFEVGLGGRLDATNFFDAHLAVLVSIGRDHMEYLGPTLSDVLNEKIEVAREGRPLISAVSQETLKAKVKDICVKRGFRLFELNENKGDSFRESNRGLARLAFETFCHELDLPFVAHQLPAHTWARPFKVTYKTTQFILLGSHNLDGLRHLATWVNEENCSKGLDCSYYDQVWVGMSRKPGKDLDQCLQLVHESPCLGQEVVFFRFDHPRATPLEEIKSSWSRLNQGRKVRFEKSWQNYLHQDHSHKNILVCGSYYFIGELLRESELKYQLQFS